MQFYVASPTRSKDVDAENPAFRFDVATLVCTTHPVKMAVLGDNRYTSLIQVDLTDEELDELIEKALEARAKRQEMKVATLTKLVESEYDAGSLSMETAERLAYLSQAVLADRTDPDNDFPEIPVYTDADAPEGDL